MPDLSPRHPPVLTCRIFGTRPVSLALENTCHTEGDKIISFVQLGGASASHPPFHQPHSPGKHPPHSPAPKFPGLFAQQKQFSLEIMPLSSIHMGRDGRQFSFAEPECCVPFPPVLLQGRCLNPPKPQWSPMRGQIRALLLDLCYLRHVIIQLLPPASQKLQHLSGDKAQRTRFLPVLPMG